MKKKKCEGYIFPDVMEQQKKKIFVNSNKQFNVSPTLINVSPVLQSLISNLTKRKKTYLTMYEKFILFLINAKFEKFDLNFCPV